MAAQGQINYRAVAAEFIGCTLFLFISIGAVEEALAGEGNWTLSVSLAFGMTITVLAYTVGHYSGAHINGAVTFGLVVAGEVPVLQGLLNFAAQLFGSITGVGLVALMTPCSKDLTRSMGSNSVADGYENYQALVGEIVCTFLLMYVVLETAVHKESSANRSLAPLAIGLAVFLAHLVMITVDGCSINPTRSMGSAVIASMREDTCQLDIDDAWTDMWIFWVGPLLGAALGVGAFKVLEPPQDNGLFSSDIKTDEIAMT